MKVKFQCKKCGVKPSSNMALEIKKHFHLSKPKICKKCLNES